MRDTRWGVAFLAVVALLALAPPAHASLVFTLNLDGCTGGCGISPFGEVTLTQDGANADVQVTLFHGDEFVKTGAGDALEFDISGDPSITITGLTSGFATGGAATASTFGSFDYSIVCTGCGHGASHPLPGPIDFTVENTLITAFTTNNHGIYFTSDIIGTDCGTGNVAGNGVGRSAVPEPFSFSLVGAGLIGLGLFRRGFSA